MQKAISSIKKFYYSTVIIYFVYRQAYLQM